MNSDNHEYRGKERRVDNGVLQRVLEDLSNKLDAMAIDIKEQKESTKELIVAWNTGKYLVAFIKWFSGVVITSGIVWGFLKGVKIL